MKPVTEANSPNAIPNLAKMFILKRVTEYAIQIQEFQAQSTNQDPSKLLQLLHSTVPTIL